MNDHIIICIDREIENAKKHNRNCLFTFFGVISIVTFNSYYALKVDTICEIKKNQLYSSLVTIISICEDSIHSPPTFSYFVAILFYFIKNK